MAPSDTTANRHGLVTAAHARPSAWLYPFQPPNQNVAPALVGWSFVVVVVTAEPVDPASIHPEWIVPEMKTSGSTLNSDDESARRAFLD